MTAWNIFTRQLIELEGYKIVLKGLLNTAIIAVFGLLLGFIVGCLCAVIKQIPTYNNKVALVFQRIVDLYVTVFRGTPMVVQLLIMHFILLPTLGIRIPSLLIGKNFAIDGAVFEAILAFGFNSGAYMSEIMRGGIDSVDRGQLEAARAVGLSYPTAMMTVVIPQAFRNVLPTLGNEFIALIKETSVCSFIAVDDLTKAFQNIANSTYEYLIPFLVLALCYLILVLMITYLVHLTERRLKHNDIQHAH
mgnify:CR=1 FL=1